MGNNSVAKFIFRLSRFLVYRGSVLGRFYCSLFSIDRLDFLPIRQSVEVSVVRIRLL